MFRFLCALTLIFTTSFCFGETVVSKADPAYGVTYAQERVVTLPQDDNKPYLTVFGSPSDPQYKQIKDWFKSNDTLTSLKDQTFYNEISTKSTMYDKRYKTVVPEGTGVYLQDAHGEPIAEYFGNKIPMSAEALAKGLNNKAATAVEFHHRKKNTDTDGETQPLSNLPPNETGIHPGVWLLSTAALAAFICGLFLGVRHEWKRTHP